MKELFLFIQSKIMSEDLGIFKQFDLWNSQTENIENDYPIDCPAAFVSITANTVAYLDKNRRIATDSSVVVYLVFQPVTDTHHQSPEQEMSLSEILDTVEIVADVLQNQGGHSFKPLVLNSIVPETNSTNLYVYTLTFATDLYFTVGSKKQTVSKIIEPSVGVEFVPPVWQK